MLPIRDHHPSGRRPYVVYGLIALNVVVFLSYAGLLDDPRSINNFFLHYAIIPARISDGYGYETLFTSLFLHAGYLHLAGNMLFLWIFGDNLEDQMGHFPFLVFYILCGLGAGIIHTLSSPDSTLPTLGASGAIAGVLGGYLLLFPRAKVDILLILIVYFRIITVPAFIMLVVWLSMQFVGVLAYDPDTGGVAYWAHSGGFAVGLVLALPLWLWRGGVRSWQDVPDAPTRPQTGPRYSPSRIPKIRRK